MNTPILSELLAHGAFLLVLAMIYDALVVRLRVRKRWGTVISGIALGLITVGVMLTPFRLAPGLVFDTRSIVLSLGGLFFGSASAAIAVLFASALRFSEGGLGTVVGVGVIVSSAAIGTIWRSLSKRRYGAWGVGELYLFGVVVHLVMLLWMLALPGGIAFSTLRRIGPSVLILYPVLSALVGRLLVKHREQQQAEKMLRRERNLLDAITEASPVAISMVEADGRISFANSTAERLLGLKKSDIAGRTYDDSEWEITGFDGGPFPVEELPFSRVMATGSAVTGVEHAIRRPNGETTLLSINGAPLFDAAGAVSGMVAVMLDVTEQVQAERQIHRLSRMYRLLSSANQVIMRKRDRGEVFSETCRIAVEVGGFALAWIALLERGQDVVIPSAFAGEAGSYLSGMEIRLSDHRSMGGPTDQAIATGQHAVINDIEHDGSMLPRRTTALLHGLRASAAFPFLIDGEVRGVLNLYAREPEFFDTQELEVLDELALDLSHAVAFAETDQLRREAEEKLAVSEARYRSFFENNHAVMWIVDPETGCILDANPAAARYYGWSRGELTAMRISEINTLSSEGISELMQRAKKSDGNRFCLKHRRADGSVRDVEVFSGTVSVQEQPLLYSIIHDITSRVEAEGQIRQALREKEVLLREIHHRVKNNLSVMSSLLRFEADRLPALGDAARALSDSQSRVLTMARIHEALYQSEDLSAVEMKRYLKRMSAELHSLQKGALPLEVEVDAEDILIDINRAIPCGLIFNELFMNAVRHAFPGRSSGCIRVGFHRVEDRWFDLTVSDDGVGMPAGEAGAPEYSSSVGMTIIRALTSQLDGTLTISSAGGTCISIRFPAAATGAPVSAPYASS